MRILEQRIRPGLLNGKNMIPTRNYPPVGKPVSKSN
jgi:hypothetical protein